MRRAARPRWASVGALAAVLLAQAFVAGCAPRKLAVRTLAKAMSSGNDVYSSDDDPELVGAALPFALKTLEGLLAADPANRDLLLACAKGFTQYTFAFVQVPSSELGEDQFERRQADRARAARLYLRARDYGLRGLAAVHPGIDEALRRDPSTAVAQLGRADVPLAYWTAAAWGSAISSGQDRPELLADLPAVRALIERGLALDEAWNAGSLHAAMLQLETALPSSLGGGSPESAKGHFDRVVELSKGRDALIYVSYAQAVAVPAQDRAGWEVLLQKALAVDVDAAPELRLENVLAHRRATWLLAHADDFFLGDEPTEAEPSSAEPAAQPTPTPGAG
jgi:predicted anti-sigma-YlaC factor YlaD